MINRFPSAQVESVSWSFIYQLSTKYYVTVTLGWQDSKWLFNSLHAG